MRQSFVCLPALVSCAWAFVVQVPPQSCTSFLSDWIGTNSIAVAGHRSCRRPGTELWGKKLTPEERQERERLLQEEEEEEKKNELREKEMQDAERRKYQSAGEERRMQEREQFVREEDPIPTNYWGVRRSLDIGEDKIRYNAYSGNMAPAVLYLPAFDAPSDDLKATSIRSYCEEDDYPFISMEWYGVGSSTGNFSEGTISRWKQDAIALIDKLLPDKGQKTVIVGGGVGGWIATLIALERPEKVAGIVGLAADPDFTENLLMRYLPKPKIKEIFEKGVATISWGRASYPVSKKLIEDARDNLVLEGPVGELPIFCPVRLVHGLDDEEVPYTVSLDLSRRLASNNVNLYLIKTANHHLDGVSILNLAINALKEVMEAYVPPSAYFTNPNL